MKGDAFYIEKKGSIKNCFGVIVDTQLHNKKQNVEDNKAGYTKVKENEEIDVVFGAI